MPDSKYRFKLYGHVSKDVDLFVKQFAAVLEIEETEVCKLLGQAPVVLREGLDEESAAKMQAICSSFGTLCLIEPMDGADTASDVAATKAPLLSGRKIRVPGDYVWIWILPAAITVFVLFVSITFFSSFRHLQRHYQPPTQSAVGGEVRSASDAAVSAATDASKSPSAIRDKIEELNSQIQERRFWLGEAEQSMFRLQMTDDPDKRDLDVLRQRIYGLQTEVGASLKELESLKKGLAEIETKRQD